MVGSTPSPTLLARKKLTFLSAVHDQEPIEFGVYCPGSTKVDGPRTAR
jgi:hypothetical protein